MSECSADPLIRHLCVILANMEEEIGGLEEELADYRSWKVLDELIEKRNALQKEVETLRAENEKKKQRDNE